MSKNQSPYMLESAYSYLRAAKILWTQPNLSGVAIVNSAIAIEIILKSFSSQPSENDRKGTVSQQYEVSGKKSHTLTKLAKEIDPEIYRKLRFHEYECWFERFDKLFVEARYPYEPGSRSGATEMSIIVGVKMFRATMNWYKESGSNDPWVVAYPDVTGGSL